MNGGVIPPLPHIFSWHKYNFTFIFDCFYPEPMEGYVIMMTVMKDDDEKLKNRHALDGIRAGLRPCTLCTSRPVLSIRQNIHSNTPCYTAPCSLQMTAVVDM
jgi:hypothetical protein